METLLNKTRVEQFGLNQKQMILRCEAVVKRCQGRPSDRTTSRAANGQTSRSLHFLSSTVGGENIMFLYSLKRFFTTELQKIIEAPNLVLLYAST